MKYNSIDNAERFLEEQVNFCKTNGFDNMVILSNGKELQAFLTDRFLQRLEMKKLLDNGFWVCFKMQNGEQVPAYL